MSKTITMEVFRAGKQTDAAGNSKEWTEKDLDQIIAATEKIGEDVPATLGHPKDDSPAFAWFKHKKLFREGKKLFAVMGDITKEFADALKRKNFKNRSVALRNDFSLRHIAFLGGVMPAVKGMAALKFNADEELQIFESDFTELTKPADKPKPGDQNMDFEKLYNEEKEANKTLTTANEKLTEDLQAKNGELETVTAEKDKFSEEAKTEKKRADDLQTEKEQFAEKAKAKEYSDFAEKLIKEENILPADKDSVIAMQKTLDGQEAIDFAEEDGKKVKKTPLDIYKLQLENSNVGGLYGPEFSGPKSPAEAQEREIEKKVEEIMEKEKLSFGEASRKLREKEPGLFENLEFTEKRKD